MPLRNVVVRDQEPSTPLREIEREKRYRYEIEIFEWRLREKTEVGSGGEIEREKGQREYGKTLKEEKRESVQEMVGETNGGER